MVHMEGRFLKDLLMRRLLLASTLLLAPTAGYAQDSIFSIAEDQQETFADVGVAGVYRDTYVGSDEDEFFVLPYVNAQYKGRLFANAGLGAGAYAIRNKNFRLGASVNYTLGRDGEDTPLDNDAFEVDAGFSANLSSRIYTPVAAIDIIASKPFTGDLDGFEVSTLVTTEFYAFNDALRVTPGVRATYQSEDYLDSLYGISASQLASLSLPVGSDVTTQSFDSEFSTLGAHVLAYYDLNDDYQLIGTFNYSRLVGDVKNTTLAPSNSGIVASFAIARTF